MTKKKLFNRLRLVAILLIIGTFIYLFCFKFHMNLHEIMKYTPNNKITAVLFFMFLYVAKGISIVAPVAVLFISSGFVFGWKIGLLVNILGLIAEHTVTWALGRTLGKSEKQSFLKGQSKLIKNLMENERHPAFQCYFLRVISVLPSDSVSMYFGYKRIPYPTYIFYSILGMLPNMISITIIGDSITDLGSPEFYISVGATLVISLISWFSFLVYKKNHKEN